MEFQSIEFTKCCHRLYSQLQQSTILDLTGEPWFRVTDENLYFCSKTTAKETASFMIFHKEESEVRPSFNPALDDPAYAPIKFTLEQLCRGLGDFFRIHYKKFD